MATLSPYIIQDLVSSWVAEDPRRLKLFLHLLSKMDEEGYVEFNAREYGRQNNLTRDVVSYMMKKMAEHAIIEQIVHQKRAIVYVCNYERYAIDFRQLSANFPPTSVITERKGRKEGSPLHPL